MGLKGLHTTLKTIHAKALVDALYAEVFDLHPADSQIDVIVAIHKDADWDDTGGLNVVDHRLFRVSNPEYDQGNQSVSPHRFLAVDGTPMDTLKEMVRWARAVPGADGFIWVHKGPEGAAYATRMLMHWNEVLGTIDFALGDQLHRWYNLGVIVNRGSSQPMKPPDSPITNTGDIEVDLIVIEHILTQPVKNKGWGPEHPYMVAMREHLDAQRYIRETEDQHGSPDHTAAHEKAVESAADMGRALLADLPAVFGSPELQSLVAEMSDGIKLYDEIKGNVPQKPEQLPPGSVFDLPEAFRYNAADNVKNPKDRLN